MPNRTQRPVLCGRSFKTTVIALAVSAALVAPTHAGFLEDFYSKSGAGANSTPPSIMKTQTLNVISGGGFMLRAPQKNFIPYHITPPSIKAGCGGIDMFMGSVEEPAITLVDSPCRACCLKKTRLPLIITVRRNR